MSLFEELKRRRVIRLIAAYVVVAWVIIQVVTAIEGPLNLPDWFDTAVIVLLGIGFPIAVIMSWVYDVTPEGIVREDGGRRPVQIDYGKIALGAVIVLGAFLAGNMIQDRTNGPVQLGVGRSGLQQFSIGLPDRFRRAANSRRPIRITTDGKRILFQASEDGRNKIILRSIERLDFEPVAGTDGAFRSLASSPDGLFVAFHLEENDRLMKVALEGGIPILLTSTAGRVDEITWGDGGSIVYTDQSTRGLLKVSSAGGDAVEFAVPEGGESYKHPSFVPGTDVVAFVIGERGNSQSFDDFIGFVTLDGEVTTTSLKGSSPRVTREGRLLFFRQNTIWIVDLDVDALTVSGNPVPLVEDVYYSYSGHFDVSAEDSLVYVRDSALGENTLVWVDRGGTETSTGLPPARYSFPSVSPNGDLVAVVEVTPYGPDAWTHSLSRGESSRWTSNEGRESSFVWSPDGDYLYFESGLRWNLMRARIDQEGSAEQLTNNPYAHVPAAMLPDGRMLIDEWQGTIGDGNNIGIIDLGSPDQLEHIMQSDYRESHPELSPDGELLAYVSDRSGSLEIFVCRFPIVENEWIRVSASGNNWAPQWAADSRELFYRDVDDELMYAVRINSALELKSTPPVPLFGTEAYVWEGVTSYDYDPTRDKFLMVKKPPPGSTEDEIVLIQNWQELLSGASATP